MGAETETPDAPEAGGQSAQEWMTVEVPGKGEIKFPPGTSPETIQRSVYSTFKDLPVAQPLIDEQKAKIAEGQKGALIEKAKLTALNVGGANILSTAKWTTEIFNSIRAIGDTATAIAADAISGDVGKLDLYKGLMPVLHDPFPRTMAGITGGTAAYQREVEKRGGLTPTQEGLAMGAGVAAKAAIGGAVSRIAGIPAGIAQAGVFGAATASETGGDPVATLQSALMAGAAPELMQWSKQAGGRMLGSLIERGMLSAQATRTHRFLEEVFAQGALQAFFEASNLPEYVTATPKERTDMITRNVMMNVGWSLMALPYSDAGKLIAGEQVPKTKGVSETQTALLQRPAAGSKEVGDFLAQSKVLRDNMSPDLREKIISLAEDSMNRSRGDYVVVGDNGQETVMPSNVARIKKAKDAAWAANAEAKEAKRMAEQARETRRWVMHAVEAMPKTGIDAREADRLVYASKQVLDYWESREQSSGRLLQAVYADNPDIAPTRTGPVVPEIPGPEVPKAPKPVVPETGETPETWGFGQRPRGTVGPVVRGSFLRQFPEIEAQVQSIITKWGGEERTRAMMEVKRLLDDVGIHFDGREILPEAEKMARSLAQNMGISQNSPGEYATKLIDDAMNPPSPIPTGRMGPKTGPTVIKGLDPETAKLKPPEEPPAERPPPQEPPPSPPGGAPAPETLQPAPPEAGGIMFQPKAEARATPPQSQLELMGEDGGLTVNRGRIFEGGMAMVSTDGWVTSKPVKVVSIVVDGRNLEVTYADKTGAAAGGEQDSTGTIQIPLGQTTPEATLSAVPQGTIVLRDGASNRFVKVPTGTKVRVWTDENGNAVLQSDEIPGLNANHIADDLGVTLKAADEIVEAAKVLGFDVTEGAPVAEAAAKPNVSPARAVEATLSKADVKELKSKLKDAKSRLKAASKIADEKEKRLKELKKTGRYGYQLRMPLKSIGIAVRKMEEIEKEISDLKKRLSSSPKPAPETGSQGELFATAAPPPGAAPPPAPPGTPMANLGRPAPVEPTMWEKYKHWKQGFWYRKTELGHEMAKVIDTTLRYGIRVFQKTGSDVAGVFTPHGFLARIREANDYKTAIHEIAHGIEAMDRDRIRAPRNPPNQAPDPWLLRIPYSIRFELSGLDYAPSRGSVREGFAELARRVIDRDQSNPITQDTVDWFWGVVDQFPGMKKAIQRVQHKIDVFKLNNAAELVNQAINQTGRSRFMGVRETFARAKTNWLRWWTTDLQALDEYEQAVFGGNKERLDEWRRNHSDLSPFQLASVTMSKSMAKVKGWVLDGVTDFAGLPVPGVKPLRDIFALVTGREDDALRWIVSKRVLETTDPKRSDFGKVRASFSALTRPEAESFIQSLKFRDPSFEHLLENQFAPDFMKWNHHLISYLADAGGFDFALMKDFMMDNMYYIPFFRVFEKSQKNLIAPEAGARGRKIESTPDVIRSIGSSGRDIDRPWDMTILHASEIVSVADKIRMARAAARLAEHHQNLGVFMQEIPPERIQEKFKAEDVAKALQDQLGIDISNRVGVDQWLTLFMNSRKAPNGYNVVSFMENGRRRHFEVSEALYELFVGSNVMKMPQWADTLLKPFEVATKIVRLGATGVNPSFALLTNPIRDFLTFNLQTEYRSYNPVNTTARYITAMARVMIPGMDQQKIKAMMQATGGQITHVLGLDRDSLREARRQAMETTATRKAMGILRHPLDAARDFLSFTEQIPRLAEFESALRETGWTPGRTVNQAQAVYAASRAAEVTVNFSRAGLASRFLNRYIPFFNPRVQGLSKFYRAHKSGPAQSIMRGLTYITIPAVYNLLANIDDPDWQNLPVWAKYGFLNVRVGPGRGEFVKLPMPFEWWWAYGAIPTAILNELYGGADEETKKVLKQGIKSNVPLPVPTSGSPGDYASELLGQFGGARELIEIERNKTFLGGRPVVPESKLREKEFRQSMPSTLKSLNRLTGDIYSTSGVDISPAKVQHVLDGVTGGALIRALSFADDVYDLAIKGKPMREVWRQPADLPLVGHIFLRDGMSFIQDEFHSKLNELDTRNRTASDLKRSVARQTKAEAAGKPVSKDEMTREKDEHDLIGLNREEKAQLRRMRKASVKISEMRGKRNLAKGRAEQNTIFREIDKLAAEAMGMVYDVNEVESEEEKAEIDAAMSEVQEPEKPSGVGRGQ